MLIVWLAGALGVQGAEPTALEPLLDANPAISRAAGNGVALRPWASEWGVRWWQWSVVVAPSVRYEVWAPDLDERPRLVEVVRRTGFRVHRLAGRSRAWGGATWSFEGRFRGSGPFTRVDNEGRAVHAYPLADWYLGVGLEQRLGTTWRLDGKSLWVRSKYTAADGTPRYGFGWVHELGVVYRPNAATRLGVRIRGLSRGISYPDLDYPRRPCREVAVGIARRWHWGEHLLAELLAELRAPAVQGPEFSLGLSLAYRRWVGVGLGYQRRSADWSAERWTLEDPSPQPDVRRWRAQGPTGGLWVRAYGWKVAVGLSPVFVPTAQPDQEVQAVRSRWVWAWSLSR